MTGGYMSTHTTSLFPRREGGSFHGKHSKKTHSASEDCSCLSHLTAFGSPLWAWQSQTLEWGQKHSSHQAFSQRTGTAPAPGSISSRQVSSVPSRESRQLGPRRGEGGTGLLSGHSFQDGLAGQSLRYETRCLLLLRCPTSVIRTVS